MPKKRTYARISVTLPEEDLAAADRAARDLDRPRSWIIAEAVRRYVAEPSAGEVQAMGKPTVAMTSQSPTRGLGESRLRQLAADLRLTPEARVRAAEETARASLGQRYANAHRLISFERYEDYLDWKRIQDAGG